MSVRTLVVLGLAVICGASSALGVFLSRDRAARAELDTVPVVVAASEISRGQVVVEAMLVTRQWPKELVPPNTSSDAATLLGRTALTPMLPNEPILLGKLADRDAGRGLAALVPEGRRAYTIQTSRVASNVAGFVMPGNRVDVLLTLRGGPDDSTGGGSSTTLLQAVEILAVDQRLDAPADHHVEPQQLRSVTLLVTPDQASLLDLGQNMGTLALSLRNPSDVAEAETDPATVNILRFTERKPVDGLASSKLLGTSFGWLTAAATALPKAAMMGSLAASARRKSAPDYTVIRTLRGRHSGRIVVRRDH